MCLPGTVQTVSKRVAAEGVPKVSRRALLGGAATAAAATAVTAWPATAAGPKKPGKRLQDLTHVFRAGFPVYAFDPPARETLVTVVPDGFYAQRWTFGEHSGTHMDAPGHFVTEGRRTPELSAAELFVPVSVIDISARVASNPDAVVTPDDLVAYERGHGRIPRAAGVFMYSGWESRVNDPAAFRNIGPDGKFHFPGFAPEAVEWLLDNRDVTCIGVDTLSLDNGPSSTFQTHITWLGADKYGLENLANLSTIPPRGALAYVGVIPWEEGSGGPCRVVATW